MGCACLDCLEGNTATALSACKVYTFTDTNGSCLREDLILGNENLREENPYHAKIYPRPPYRTHSKLFAEFPLVQSLWAAQRINRRRMNDARDPFISRLPTELASHIFTYFLPVDVDNSYSVSNPTGRQSSPPITPLRLGAVCQTWREIAWATPALWSSISIDMYATRESTAELVRDWLGRSGQLPLYIRLYAGFEQGALEYYPAPLHSDAPIQKLFDAVNSFSQRWTYVDLELPTSYMRHVQCSSVDSARPASVKTLQINVLSSEVLEAPLDGDKKIDLHGILSPTTLVIRGLHLPQIGIEWDNLTHVEAFDLSVSECMDLLQQAPAMTHFVLTRLNGTLHTPGLTTDLCHQELRSITFKAVHQYATVALNALFDQTSFPGLTHIAFEQVAVFVDPHASIQPILSHFSRSGTRLLDLEMKISTLPIDYQKITAMLHAVPTLEKLTVEFGRYETTPCLDPLLSVFASPGSNGKMIIPRLKSLIINKTCFSWERLGHIVFPDPAFVVSAASVDTETGVPEAGRRNVSFLRIVLPWTSTSFFDAKAIQAVASLKSSGLQIQISDECGRDLVDSLLILGSR